jgi:Domain of Unknown Function (DUF1206)
MSAGLGLRRRVRGHARNRHGPAGDRQGYARRRRYGRPYARRRNGGGSGSRTAGGAGALNMFARLGFVARGIAYIVLGAIAVMVALRVARQEPDSAGAIEAIAARPFGYLLLWILVIGFLGLAVWRFVQAAVRRLNLTEGHRVRALVCGIGYAIAFVTTLLFVVHGTKPAAGDSSARDYTAHVLSLDGGRVLVAIAGIALVAIGIIMAVRGFGAEFTRHLRMGWMSRSTQDAVVRLGQAGYVARGAVIAGIGIAGIDAALTYDAAKARGVDGVLRSFARSPFGPWLLILVALGLIAFGILSFAEAKWRRTLGGVPV